MAERERGSLKTITSIVDTGTFIKETASIEVVFLFNVLIMVKKWMSGFLESLKKVLGLSGLDFYF